MDTNELINLEISLDELIEAFMQLPPSPDQQTQRHSVKFTVTDGYGNPRQRELLFSWKAEQNSWELNTVGHDLLITYCPILNTSQRPPHDIAD